MYGRTSLISVLVLLFGAVVFAQTEQCPKIKIDIRDYSKGYLMVGDTFIATASFENPSPAFNAKFDWIIIRKNDVIRINEKEMIEITTDFQESEIITVVVEPAGMDCSNMAVRNVEVIRNPGTPRTIDKYSSLPWKDEKIRLDAVVADYLSMVENKEFNLFVFISYRERTTFPKLKDRITKIFSHFVKYRKLPENSLTFIMREFQDESTSFMILPRDYYHPSNLNGLVIRGGDFEKLEKLFQTSAITKQRKN